MSRTLEMAGMQELARVGKLEFEEIQELELLFTEDLERVFEGKQADFGNHLRGMLFELWSRARGTKSDIVKELDELRQLRSEKHDLEALIADGIKAQLPLVAEQFKSTFDNVMATNLATHLQHELEFPNSAFMIDDAMAAALARVLQVGEDLELVKEPGKLIIKTTGSSSFPELEGDNPTEEDQTQLRLRKRLRFEGLVPSEDFHASWEWAPVFVNTESGERAAFHHWNWKERFNPNPEEVRVPLAWDGGRWVFPNPRPRGSKADWPHLEATLTIYVDGVEQDSSQFTSWQWDWEQHYAEAYWMVTSVSGIPCAGMGTEIVEARYRVVASHTVV